MINNHKYLHWYEFKFKERKRKFSLSLSLSLTLEKPAKCCEFENRKGFFLFQFKWMVNDCDQIPKTNKMSDYYNDYHVIIIMVELILTISYYSVDYYYY